MNDQHVYYYRFEGEPIGRYSYAFGYITHACRIVWIDTHGEERELVGYASSEASAKRNVVNLITRNEKRIEGANEYDTAEVVLVGKQPLPGIKGVDRFLKLYWKPKGMPAVWDKHLHFKGRYLVTGEGQRCWYVIIDHKEYVVGKVTGEIVWLDDKGKRVKGGPIFVKDF